MGSRASNFCIDAADRYAQSMWWAKVLEDFTVEDDWEMKPYDEECGLAGPDDRYLLFLKVPEPKTVKNRIHWDLWGDTRDALAAGATLLRAEDDDIRWDVLADPDGNEFCIFDGE